MQERKRRRKERGREKGIKPRWIKNTFQEKTPHKTEKMYNKQFASQKTLKKIHLMKEYSKYEMKRQ